MKKQVIPKELVGFTVIEILALNGDTQALPTNRILLDAKNFVRCCNASLKNVVFHKGCIYFIVLDGYILFCRIDDGIEGPFAEVGH